jgi:anion-transporting  ArsA/GET3 family ATPase
MLVVRFADSAALAPNRERYEAFMKEFGEEQSKRSTEYAQENYPGMREITGEYRFRRITLK